MGNGTRRGGPAGVGALLAGEFWQSKSYILQPPSGLCLLAGRRAVKTSNAADAPVAHLTEGSTPHTPVLAQRTWPIGRGGASGTQCFCGPLLEMIVPGTQRNWKADPRPNSLWLWWESLFADVIRRRDRRFSQQDAGGLGGGAAAGGRGLGRGGRRGQWAEAPGGLTPRSPAAAGPPRFAGAPRKRCFQSLLAHVEREGSTERKTALCGAGRTVLALKAGASVPPPPVPPALGPGDGGSESSARLSRRLRGPEWKRRRPLLLPPGI